MNPKLKNALSVVAGIVGGSIVNMGIIMIGSAIIPPPDGMDIMDPDSIKAMMHLFEPKHFISPFLAHSIGTLAGAALSARLATKNNLMYALGTGIFFLAGGIYNVASLPSPVWYSILDLTLAYIPMAWLGWKLSGGK